MSVENEVKEQSSDILHEVSGVDEMMNESDVSKKTINDELSQVDLDKQTSKEEEDISGTSELNIYSDLLST